MGDIATGKIAAYSSKNLTAQVAAKHIFTHICATSRPASVAVDHGSEFKSGRQDQLASYNIALEATSPYIKSSTSTAECSIRLLKRALKRICLYDPANWDQQLPLVLDAVNNSSFYGCTRDEGE